MDGVLAELSQKLSLSSKEPRIRPLGVKRHYTLTPMTPIHEMSCPDLIITLDEVLNHIGFGKYQLFSFIVIGLMLINDGAEILMLAFLISILKNDWNLGATQTSLFGSFVFAGFFLGAVFSARVSDWFGRAKVLAGLEVLIYLFGIISASTSQFFFITVIRGLYGLLLGLQFPACFNYLSEITPQPHRLKILLLTGFFVTLGKIFAAFIADLTLANTASGDWHSMLFWVVQPSALGLIALAFFLKESPYHQLMIKKNVDEAIETLKSMWRFNYGEGQAAEFANLFTARNKLGLKNWSDSHKIKTFSTRVSDFKHFMRQHFKTSNMSLWVTWFILPTLNYGIIYLLPTVLTTYAHFIGTDYTVIKVLAVVLAEVPSVAIAHYSIERNKLDSKRLIVLGMVGTLSSVMIMVLFHESYIILGMSSARFFLNICSQAALWHNAQLYPSSTRRLGIAVLGSWSRFAVIFMPWIVEFFLSFSVDALFLGYAALAGAGIISASFLPYAVRVEELEYEEMEIINRRMEINMLDSGDL